MRNSLLISLCVLLFASCASTRNIPSQTTVEKSIFDTEKVSEYRVQIKINQAELSGIMIVKYMNDEWRGTLINEFGIKAFDFIAPKGKCKLQNVTPFLDKWYIRKTIESDFVYLLWDEQKSDVKGKSFTQLSDGAFVLKNEKRGIEYLFQPIEK